MSGQLNFSAESESAAPLGDAKVIPEGHTAIVAHVPGNVWKITAQLGQRVTAAQPVVILESMKMEISIAASGPGEITEVFCAEGRPVQAGDVLMVFKPDA